MTAFLTAFLTAFFGVVGYADELGSGVTNLHKYLTTLTHLCVSVVRESLHNILSKPHSFLFVLKEKLLNWVF